MSHKPTVSGKVFLQSTQSAIPLYDGAVENELSAQFLGILLAQIGHTSWESSSSFLLQLISIITAMVSFSQVGHYMINERSSKLLYQ